MSGRGQSIAAMPPLVCRHICRKLTIIISRFRERVLNAQCPITFEARGKHVSEKTGRFSGSHATI
jgi:hypothetical protein